jgi:UDP-N-acetyl-D-glucosamine/UDP-N-acetyl-D-galactosamine dehydrogenase
LRLEPEITEYFLRQPYINILNGENKRNMVSFESLINRKDTIGVVGLGYVGLPLAVHLSRHFNVVGYDLKSQRINELNAGHDRTLEVSPKELKEARVRFTDKPEDLSECRLIIVAVPTPIHQSRIPDLRPLEGASTTVGKYMPEKSCVVFESTVYPGATEEVCVPIMEKESGLLLGKDFTVGYSPERINPGDKVHSIDTITKIVSGSDHETLELLCPCLWKNCPCRNSQGRQHKSGRGRQSD